jgi:hypothetical protein
LQIKAFQGRWDISKKIKNDGETIKNARKMMVAPSEIKKDDNNVIKLLKKISTI